MAVGWNVS